MNQWMALHRETHVSHITLSKDVIAVFLITGTFPDQ
jgi:hypothetical protein